MQKKLKRIAATGHYFLDENGVRINGAPEGVSGDLTGIRGNLTGIRGDLTGIRGDLTGISGDVDKCGLTAEDRKRGVHISDLVG